MAPCTYKRDLFTYIELLPKDKRRKARLAWHWQHGEGFEAGCKPGIKLMQTRF